MPFGEEPQPHRTIEHVWIFNDSMFLRFIYSISQWNFIALRLCYCRIQMIQALCLISSPARPYVITIFYWDVGIAIVQWDNRIQESSCINLSSETTMCVLDGIVHCQHHSIGKLGENKSIRSLCVFFGFRHDFRLWLWSVSNRAPTEKKINTHTQSSPIWLVPYQCKPEQMKSSQK